MNRPIPDEHGACAACERTFVAVVTNPDTEALYGGDGYCHGCAKWRARNGWRHPVARYATAFPPGAYRCPNDFDTTLRKYEEWRTAREARLMARHPMPR